MAQRRDRTSFAFESGVSFGFFGKMLRQDFDGDSAVETRVARTVNLAHATGAEAGLNFVWTELAARAERHCAGESIAQCEGSGRTVTERCGWREKSSERWWAEWSSKQADSSYV